MDEIDNNLEATDQAPVADQGNPDDGQVAAPVTDSAQPIADGTQGQQQAEETFLDGDGNLDPRKLDAALQPIFKRMQAAYTKRMQGVAEIREKAAVVDRFYNDANFAHQTLAQWATQNGYTLTPVGGGNQNQQQPARQQGGNGQAPAFLVEQFKANLQPELHWMAEPLANAMAASMQGMLAPVFQEQTQAQQKARESEWDKSATELANVAPGWEEHEDTMGELFDFMRSPNQYHPVYGSKLQMLYNLATANAASMKKTQQRVAQAGKNLPTSTNRSGRPATGLGDPSKISTQDAWKLAVQQALAQHKKTA